MKSAKHWADHYFENPTNLTAVIADVQAEATASTRDAFMMIITEVLPPVWAYVSQALESLGDADKVKTAMEQAAERAEQLARQGYAEPCPVCNSTGAGCGSCQPPRGCPHGVRSAADCQDCQHSAAGPCRCYKCEMVLGGGFDGWIAHSYRQPEDGARVYLDGIERARVPAVWIADPGYYVSGASLNYGGTITPAPGLRWQPRAERRDIDDAIARANPFIPADYAERLAAVLAEGKRPAPNGGPAAPVGSGVGFRLAPAERAWHGPWFNVAERVPELAWQPVYIINPGTGAEQCAIYDCIANTYLTALGVGRYIPGVVHWRPIDRGERVWAYADKGARRLATWAGAWCDYRGTPLAENEARGISWWEPAPEANAEPSPVPGVYTPSQGAPASPAEVADRRLFAAARAVLALLESWDYTGAEVAELAAALAVSDYTTPEGGAGAEVAKLNTLIESARSALSLLTYYFGDDPDANSNTSAAMEQLNAALAAYGRGIGS